MNKLLKYGAKSDSEWAVITGASSGIGLQYSIVLARLGYNIVLVSNQQEQLEKCREEIESLGVQALSLYIDLSEEDAAYRVFDFCASLNVVILINNAGIFEFRQIENMPSNRVEIFMGLHMATFTRLCRLFSKNMAQKRYGYILNMSSLAGFLSLPGITMYEATKSYIRIFSRAMWYELREYGVGMTVICPGGVDTGLYGLRSDLLRLGVRLGILTPTEKLVRNALKAMFRRRRQYIPGAVNVIFLPILKVLPRSVVMYAKRKLAKYEKQ